MGAGGSACRAGNVQGTVRYRTLPRATRGWCMTGEVTWRPEDSPDTALTHCLVSFRHHRGYLWITFRACGRISCSMTFSHVDDVHAGNSGQGARSRSIPANPRPVCSRRSSTGLCISVFGPAEAVDVNLVRPGGWPPGQRLGCSTTSASVGMPALNHPGGGQSAPPGRWSACSRLAKARITGPAARRRSFACLRSCSRLGSRGRGRPAPRLFARACGPRARRPRG